MTYSSIIKSTFLGLGMLCTTLIFAQKDKKQQKNKFLEGKTYTVTFTEIKAKGQQAKPLSGAINIKSGKVQSPEMEAKLTAPAIPYTVSLDTTFVEDESDVRKINFIAEYNEEKTTYKWDVSITDYSIEGNCVLLKGGVEKKKFEFTGEEKSKKK